MQRRWSVLMMGLVLCVCCDSSALATPPTDWEVGYGIHETPSEPESPLIFAIEMSLTRIHIVGNSIGWGIAAVEIRQIGQDGSTTARWAKLGPSVSTADGLWWVNHANANSPQPAECKRRLKIAAPGG